MATRDERDLARKRRMKGNKGGRPSLWERANPKPSKPRKQTSFDLSNQSLRCMNCDRIFNGPHTGEVVKLRSKRYKDINQEDYVASGYDSKAGISDTVCNKRSCIDAVAEKDIANFQATFPDREFNEDYRDSYRKSLYQDIRSDPDRYPEGLIDDVEPPL